MSKPDSLILSAEADGVATITLNNPDQRNVVSLAMNAELIETMDRIEADPSIGAVVITGAPPAFCAGANLDDLAAAEHRDSLMAIYAGFLRVAHSTLPTLAAVNGPAVGAGMNFALGCDVIVAAESARFDTRFLQIGIHPGGGHTWRLQQITDRQTAMAMVLFGQVADGREAERIGLAWRCVADDELASYVQEIAARAASFPRDLVSATKATIVAGASINNSTEAVELELGPQHESMLDPVFVERLSVLREQIKSKR